MCWRAGVPCWWGVLGWRDQRAARLPACVPACLQGRCAVLPPQPGFLASLLHAHPLPACCAACCAATLPPAPQRILAPKAGFMGMVGERGIGGSKCGSTAAVAMLYKSKVRGEGAGQAGIRVVIGVLLCVCVVGR